MITPDCFPLNQRNMSNPFKAWIKSLPEELRLRLVLSARKLETPRYVYARLNDESYGEFANEILFDAMSDLVDTTGAGVAVAYVMLNHEDGLFVHDKFRFNGTATFSVGTLDQYCYCSIDKIPRRLEENGTDQWVSAAITCSVMSCTTPVEYALVMIVSSPSYHCAIFPGSNQVVGESVTTSALIVAKEKCGLIDSNVSEVNVLSMYPYGSWNIEYHPPRFMMTLGINLGMREELPQISCSEEETLAVRWVRVDGDVMGTLSKWVINCPSTDGKSPSLSNNVTMIVENGFRGVPLAEFEAADPFDISKWLVDGMYDCTAMVRREEVVIGHNVFRVKGSGFIPVVEE